MTQHTLILHHIKRTGGITMREAMIEYSIQSLPKRISELRAKGYPVVGIQKAHPITGQLYTRYVLQEAVKGRKG